MAMESSSCTCKSTPRPCVFFHGIGNYNEMEELQDTPKKASGRMGNMNAHAPCCTEVKYAILNTMDHSWRSASLQQKFCDRALRLSDTSDGDLGVIKDTVVVTHSMGGLVMSMALATGKCSFGEGASWVALSSPMMGSMASDYFQDFCNDEVSDFATDLLDVLGQCPMPVSRRSIVYQNEKYASKELNAAYIAAQEAYAGNVSAAMCSDNPNGIFSQYEAIMLLAAELVPHKSPENDGLVEFQGCAIGLDESQFGKSYKDKFYRPELNHADTVFLTGDGFFKDSQKPVKWFECLL
uniref:AB hydrolase-1 domain-containing protein n=2 Tax=Phytophthora ramorum TaxID=164328 RepID=H3H728_PHYRM